MNTSTASTGDNYRKDGYTIRAVREAPKAIDLGLPSGTLWCDRNVGATAITDYGSYFSWGNIEGHKSSNGSTFDDGYNWGFNDDGPYASTPGALIQFINDTGHEAYTEDSGYDAAREYLGGHWRVPTRIDIEELINNTTFEWTTLNSVIGAKLTSKINNNSLFIPASGWGLGTSVGRKDERAVFTSSSLFNDTGSYLFLSKSEGQVKDFFGRFYGLPVRAVQ